MPVVCLAAPVKPLRRTVSLGAVPKTEGLRSSTEGSDLMSNVILQSKGTGPMGLKRKRSSLPRQLSRYFSFEEEKEEKEEEDGAVGDVGEASIWYSPSPHPSVSS